MSFKYLNFRLIGILRTKKGTSFDNTVKAIECAFNNGLEAVEITSNSDHWQEVVKYFSNLRFNIGVGSVKNKGLAQRAIDLGARFFVSPGFFEEVVIEAQKNNVPIMTGVFTVTDFNKAIKYKVPQIKFFPANASTHEELYKAIKEPFRDEFQELENNGCKIIDFNEYHKEPCRKVNSATEFYEQYLKIKNEGSSRPIVIEYPDGKKGFERLKEFSLNLSEHGIRTYAIGGINTENMREVLTSYGVYGLCPGSGMFDGQAILEGNYEKIRSGVKKHVSIIMMNRSETFAVRN